MNQQAEEGPQRERITCPGCVFCQIVAADTIDGVTTELLYEDSRFAVFKDIKPAAVHHYLVVPKDHIRNAKTLVEKDIEMVREMRRIGLEVLSREGGDAASSRLGFHWPPFNTVSHLHLHVISPANGLSFIHRQMFRPKSWWFVTVEDLLEWLSNCSR